MQNWKDLYIEIAEKIDNGLEAIRWVDLWHNQVYFLEEEHPFPTPAVFLAFRGRQFKDLGDKVQDVSLQMDVFLFYETFKDTYLKGVNQETALEFLDLLDGLNALLHGSGGKNYSSMRRIGLAPVDSGGSGNLYQLVYECTLMDFSAQKVMEEGIIEGFEVEKLRDKENDFFIP
ncbi:hypothetical protein ETU08_01840 [Apibacter muscae]|uniref:Uncharacterized protein n=1 Tax=Apibacter muscae TaxID=2509004 RepID=A0A563DJW8_9FLAO|nr:hypothetical protein [Apibacter muscae]TWP23514.1 hypothetical protein ETU10_07260 [Apibacter muscae]TWP30526.1 hypothetical protein ETU09_00565 [Apibacter muscae]TWP31247.1 hypothetical protein ETU08_01840 [Apibacter muscae]